MGKWILGTLAFFFLVFCATALITGEPAFIIPVAILAALFLGYMAVEWMLSRRVMRQHHGDWGEAMADNEDPVPGAHLIPDDTRPFGDTAEAHDEINPHDLPLEHPGRGEAEREAGREEQRGEVRTTRGSEELAKSPPEREERLEPSGKRRRER
jgi:hypothetical protein